ncbi:MAG: ABC transporter ATP-binding protein [Bryobacteraceae bacterium]|nr:ABC transporter ATP-binding protein [Bryobacteraceae bacterium]
MSAFSLSNVGMSYGRSEVLSDISIEFSAPGLTAIIGPNGAGKSTLLSVMAGLLTGYRGQCLFNGREVRSWSRKSFTRLVSFVPQRLRLEFPFTAEQVVMMGRSPYCDGLFEAPDDHVEVEKAMMMTDTLEFRSRDFRFLSGGERQRVILAAALAQTTPVLLLDEPTTFLDLRHQVSIYALLRQLASAGRLVITVTHDLNLAAAYADRVIMLRKGRLAAAGPPSEVLSSERIRSVFEVEADVLPGPHGKPWILYGGESRHT